MVQLLGSSQTMQDIEPPVSASTEDFDPLQDAHTEPAEGTRTLRYNRDVQGNVLAAFNKDHETFRMLHFAGTEQARTWLLSMLGHISTTPEVEQFNEQYSLRRRIGGVDPQDLKATWVSVSLTYQGLQVLVGNDQNGNRLKKLADDINKVENNFPDAATRAEHLGDIGRSSPALWEFGNTQHDPAEAVHAVVIVAADDEEDLKDREACLTLIDKRTGTTEVHHLAGKTLPGDLSGHEHFGFKDGVSQPGVTDFHKHGLNGQRLGHPGTQMIQPGEFVLGHRREPKAGTSPKIPSWMRDGSFQVVRKLEQDVPGFRKLIDDLVKQDPKLDHELAGAMVVGRFPDGRPLARPTHERRGLGPDLNDFDYHGDPDGKRTPCSSHVRKTNPRAWIPSSETKADLKKDGDKDHEQLKHHRIMRRGIPYGEVYEKGKPDTSKRGLVFVAYCASLTDQFEFQQAKWSNNKKFNPGAHNAATGIDPVIGVDPETVLTEDITSSGQGTSAFECPSGRKTLSFDRVVHTRGAVYAFTPSMTTLRKLAEGATL
ncbi:Dyp-type peroxidase [Amycolatopsis sp. NPDC051045]|uniref:Dyp-type peroxidase n=1 Tax=Amycolatopsis sp. NPDC051045 TaxID=3156922 RepID=UPI003434517A